MQVTLTGQHDGQGVWYTNVRLDGRLLDPQPSQKLVNHSPDGFAWGYGGSGPAQLALAVLLAAGVTPSRAIRLHQHFSGQYIGRLPQADFVLEVDVLAWADQQERNTAAGA